MATVEPWLTNVLNKPRTPDLPPIHPGPFSAAPSQSISLPPLAPELTGSHRVDRPAPAQVASLYGLDDVHHGKPPARADDTFGLHTASIRPLQLLLREPAPAPPTIPLSKIVDDGPGSSEDTSTKKRHRAPTTKEDFVQLPKLPKKQKSAQQVVPPIIAGLHEPPPDPAVFPPITSASFDDNENFSLAGWKDLGSAHEDRPVLFSAADTEQSNPAEPSNPPKPKRRPMKPRRKWTEEETNNLLLGVSRHGVGRWTTILEDPDFKFNGRTAGDLKDRFRTCCPQELRLTAADEPSAYGELGTVAGVEGGTRQHKTGWYLEDILLPTGDETADNNDGASPSAAPDSDAAPKKRKPRAHRKKLEDLAELGIHGPFEKSHRRKRRPFTKQDDDEILDGLNVYGPSWTRIQRDPKYNLSTRQPTDLRDRVRNKYPEIYANIEKANLLNKEIATTRGGGGRASTTTLLEPSVNLVIPTDISTNSGNHPLGGNNNAAVHPSLPLDPQLQPQPQLNRSASKEDMLFRRRATPAAYESTESLPALAELFDMGEAVAHGGGGGGTSVSASGSFSGGGAAAAPEMMDLGHLLLDEGPGWGERRAGVGMGR